MKANWRVASTLILASLKNAQMKKFWNYAVLTLERSSKSSFMPGGLVFPGGTVESSDSDASWLDHLSKFNIDCKNFLQNDGDVPPVLQDSAGKIPKMLSLKITAIRETFEEAGILLCFSKTRQVPESENWVSFENINDLNMWREKVQKNPSEFLNLCKEYDCCPDVNGLHLWSNWLTPTSMGKKRFDTVFFMAAMKDCPFAEADKKEIENISWLTPGAIMNSCRKGDTWLPPPQFYETSRLFQFKDVHDLASFAKDRASKGCRRWMPVQYQTSDGLVSVLPGDDAYVSVDFNSPSEPRQVGGTMEQFRSQSKVLHRMEFSGPRTRIVTSNYSPPNGHVPPVREEDLDNRNSTKGMSHL